MSLLSRSQQLRIAAVLCYLMFIGDFFLGIARRGPQAKPGARAVAGV